MTFVKNTALYILVILVFIQCKEASKDEAKTTTTKNSIQYAKGLEIYKQQGFSIVKITNPWPDAKESFTYILQEKNGIIPDSLQQFDKISVPIKNIVVTSTTHLPSLEMLGVENTLIGFPQLNFISSVYGMARRET